MADRGKAAGMDGIGAMQGFNSYITVKAFRPPAFDTSRAEAPLCSPDSDRHVLTTAHTSKLEAVAIVPFLKHACPTDTSTSIYKGSLKGLCIRYGHNKASEHLLNGMP